MKNKLKKILGMLLSITLISNSVDIAGLTVHAAEGARIVAFEALAAEVQNQTVSEGGTEADIIFPDTLNVTVQKEIRVLTQVERVVPVETEVATVSGSDAEAGNDVSGGDASENAPEATAIEWIEETRVVEETVTINVLGWELDAANSMSDSFVAEMSTYGYSYTYVPKLNLVDEDGCVLTIADGVKLPTITVTIGPAVVNAGMATFTVNYYVEVEPGSDSRAIAVTNPKNSAETKYFLHMEQLVVNYTEGQVVRSAYGVDTGAQMVHDVSTNSTIAATVRNYDYAEIAGDYDSVTGTEVNGGEGTVTADGSLTFNFYWKTATYSEYHLVEVETSGSTSGLISYNGKYYQILQTNEVKVTSENANTTVTIPDLSGTDGFEAYTALTTQASTYPTSGTVDSLGQLCLYRFYDKQATASYTEKYYVEDETVTENYIQVNTTRYRLHHENTVENAVVGSRVTITDLSQTPEFAGYTLVDVGYPAYALVEEDNLSSVYQFYDKNQTCNYSVVYYVEVFEHQKDGSNITVNVNGTDKYYNRITDSAYNMACQAPEGTIITVADSSSDIPGVYAGGVAVSDTWKGYTTTLRKYSYATTVAYGKHTGAVAADGSLQIVLFYDWLDSVSPTAEYTEKYYVECEIQNTTNYDIDVDGVKYELLHEDEKTGTVGTEVSIGAITWEGQESYYPLSATDEHPANAVIAADGTTVLYQFYRLHPHYQVLYYTEAEDGTLSCGGKNYSWDTLTLFTGRAPAGTVVSYRKPDDGGVVITIDGVDVANSFKTYDSYEFNVDITEQYGSGSKTLTEGSRETIILFFDKIVPTTTYTEKYYVEYDDQSVTVFDLEVDGVKYELMESYTYTIDKDLGAEIADKSTVTPYSKYELQPATATYPSEVADVADDNSTVLYQFYRLQPQYTVRYYKEAEADTDGVICVGDKYYVLAEAVSGEARSNSAVSGKERTDGAVGVTVNSAENADSFKSYAHYVFNPDATALNNKATATVMMDGENVVELFFDKAYTASYRCEYYVELEDQSTTDFDKKIAGVKYELKDSYPVAGVAYDTRVEIVDKSAEYGALGYDLMPDTTEYPSWCVGVNEDGSTVLYQIYRLRPRYTVRYYTEVNAENDRTVTVGGKYYVLQESDTIVNYPAEGTVVTYAELHTGAAGVAEDGGGVAETVRGYDGYVFSSIASRLNGNVSGTVTRDTRVVIELFFDMVRTDYTEIYWVENPDATTDYIEVKIDGAVRKFVVGKTYTVEDEWINAKVAVRDRDDEFAGYKAVYDDVTDYSSVAYGLNGDGSTQVHRFYVLKQEATQTNPPAAVLPDNPPASEEPVRKKAPKTGDKGNWRNALMSICAAYIAALLWKRRNQ